MEAWLLGLCIYHQRCQSGQGQERIEGPHPLAPEASGAGNLSRIEGGMVAHRYAIFLLKYSIGWRPQKDSIEKSSD